MKFLQKSLEVSYAFHNPVWNKQIEHRCQHFSIIFNRNKILAIGRNKLKTTPLNLRNAPPKTSVIILSNKNTCAEFDAFRILRNRSNITGRLILVNVRIDRNGHIRNSHPCRFCQNLIRFLNFREVWYSTENGFKKYE